MSGDFANGLMVDKTRGKRQLGPGGMCVSI
jgi:hypothetical protein